MVFLLLFEAPTIGALWEAAQKTDGRGVAYRSTERPKASACGKRPWQVDRTGDVFSFPIKARLVGDNAKERSPFGNGLEIAGLRKTRTRAVSGRLEEKDSMCDGPGVKPFAKTAKGSMTRMMP